MTVADDGSLENGRLRREAARRIFRLIYKKAKLGLGLQVRLSDARQGSLAALGSVIGR
jgi:hypothetical protein